MNKQVLLFFVVAGTTALCSMIHSADRVNQGIQGMDSRTTTATKESTMTQAQFAQFAQQHFSNTASQALKNIFTNAQTIINQYKIHQDIAAGQFKNIQEAFDAGFKQGLTLAGQYMQTGLDAMAKQLNPRPNQPTQQPQPIS